MNRSFGRGGGWARNRGFRGRGFSWKQDRDNVQANDGGSRQNLREEYRDTDERPPKHLRGREIGMWYAQRSRMRREQGIFPKRDDELLVTVRINETLKADLRGAVDMVLQEIAVPRQARNLSGLINKRNTEEPNLDAKPKSINPEIAATRKKLPVYSARKQILELVNSNQVCVIAGETGSGKTTQIPQFLLDDCSQKGRPCHIICTQPRRISAITIAERVALERGEAIGEAGVGYKIRLQQCMPKETNGSIMFCTTGIILQYLQSDPLLGMATHIIVDEVHERSIHSDLLLTILKHNILAKRPDLKIICMSATLDAETFINYFNGQCGSMTISGRLFPVTEYYLEDFCSYLRYTPQYPQRQSKRDFARMDDRAEALRRYGYSSSVLKMISRFNYDVIDADLVVATIEFICATKDDGAILVFLPGWEAISTVNNILKNKQSSLNMLILPLHSILPTCDQRRVFDRPPRGIRKVILSTILAEASVTIEDVVFVIDTGKTKLTTIDVSKQNLTCLGDEVISKANAEQRKGRAGRVRAGHCYRLYTKMDYENMLDYQLPEMARTRLEGLILYIKELNLGLPEEFLLKCISPPMDDAIKNSVEILKQLGALDPEGKITALGKHLSIFPIDPRLGKMLILSSLFCVVDPVLSIAACMDFKDPYVTPMGKNDLVDRVREQMSMDSMSDHIMLANTLEQSRHQPRSFLDRNFLSGQSLKMLYGLREQYLSHLKEQNLILQDVDFNQNRNNWNILKAVICGGLYPNISVGRFKHPYRGRRRDLAHGEQQLKSLFTNSERRLSFHLKSVLARTRVFNTQFFAYYLKQKTASGVSIFDATPVNALPLVLFSGDCSYDSATKRFTINGWISLACEPPLAQLIMDMKTAFDHILTSRLFHVNTPAQQNLLALLGEAFDQEVPEIVLCKIEDAVDDDDVM